MLCDLRLCSLEWWSWGAQEDEVVEPVPVFLREILGPVSPPDVGGGIARRELISDVSNLEVRHLIAPSRHDERPPALRPIADPRVASEHQGSALAGSYRLLRHVANSTVSR